MILTPSFVFIHYPKTGGTFVSTMLHRLWDGRSRHRTRVNWFRRRTGRNGTRIVELNKHGTCREIPASHDGRAVLSCIRSPYDRLVSQYEFRWWRDQPPAPVDQIRKEFPDFP